MIEYQPHPLCELFPQMPDAEMKELALDIQKNGILCPIILEPDTNLILDGHHRYIACRSIGIEPRFSYFQGKKEMLLSFVLSMNLHRRHLTPGQSAVIVAKAQDWNNAHSYGGDRKSDQGALVHLDSREYRAAITGVSERTQAKADKVAKADPDLCKEVIDGKKSLNEAVKEIDQRRKPVDRPSFERPKNEYEEEEPDWKQEFVHQQLEIDQMHSLITSLQSSDQAKEITEWHKRFTQMENRLQQLNTTLNECQKQATWQGKQLKILREIFQVETTKELIEKAKLCK